MSVISSRSGFTQRSRSNFSTASTTRTRCTGNGGMYHVKFNRYQKVEKQFPNLPNNNLTKDDLYDPAVMFGLSTRKHVKDLERVMSTGQKPADTPIQCIEMTEDPEMIFSGGDGFPIVLDMLPYDSPAYSQGISEGFVLVSLQLERIPMEWTVEQVYEKINDELGLNQNKSHHRQGGICVDLYALQQTRTLTLGFLSPMGQNPPNLSNRQCSKRLGIDKVKRMHIDKVCDTIEARCNPEQMFGDEPLSIKLQTFHNILLDAGLRWFDLKDSRRLFRKLDTDQSGTLSLQEWKDGMQQYFVLDDNTFHHLGKNITRFHIHAVTRELNRVLKEQRRSAEARLKGHKDTKLEPFKNRGTKLVPFKKKSTTNSSGRQSIVQGSEDGDTVDENRNSRRLSNGSFCVEDLETDHHRDDSQSHGLWAKIGLIPFYGAMYGAGITWLTREQISIMFDHIDTNQDGFITMAEWIAQFKFEAAESAREVQFAINNKNREMERIRDQLAREASSNKRSLQTISLPEQKNAEFVVPDEMIYTKFVECLFKHDVHWLTDKQIGCIFNALDIDRNGTITKDEWDRIYEGD